MVVQIGTWSMPSKTGSEIFKNRILIRAFAKTGSCNNAWIQLDPKLWTDIYVFKSEPDPCLPKLKSGAGSYIRIRHFDQISGISYNRYGSCLRSCVSAFENFWSHEPYGSGEPNLNMRFFISTCASLSLSLSLSLFLSMFEEQRECIWELLEP